MKNFTAKDYEKEIIRQTKILTQRICCEQDSVLIKCFLSENLENYELLRMNSSRWNSKSKLEHLIELCKKLACVDYGSEKERLLKVEINNEFKIIKGGV